MIDGVKLLCNLNPNDWTNNTNLSFRSWIDEATGEVPKDNKHANINGLYLSIIKSEKDTFCNVRGSLPKYFTKGETNANDYYFRDFLTTCDQLQENLSVEPNKALLRGFEFGVNINLPFDCSNVLEYIKSYKMHSFGTYTEKGKDIGIYFDFQQYRVKIYDKGMQSTGKKSRLMRFEIDIKKMNWIKKLEIKSLSDLQNVEKWAELSKILLTVWNDIIFIDKSLKYKLMNNHEQKKYLYYFNTHYWTNLNKKQYSVAKNHLNKLQNLYCGKENTKKIVLDLIASKCGKLATETTVKNGYDLTKVSALENSNLSQPLEKTKWVLFNPLDKGIDTGNSLNTHASIFNTKNNTFQSSSKNIDNEHTEIIYTQKKHKCMNCKKNITQKKQSAKFCGLKCKNQYNGKRRTKANQQRLILEQRELKKILPKLPETNLALLVIYKVDRLQYAEYLHQKELQPPPEWIKQVRKVLITDNKNAPPVEFTTIRAKQLIKEIVKLNTKTF